MQAQKGLSWCLCASLLLKTALPSRSVIRRNRIWWGYGITGGGSKANCSLICQGRLHPGVEQNHLWSWSMASLKLWSLCLAPASPPEWSLQGSQIPPVGPYHPQLRGTWSPCPICPGEHSTIKNLNIHLVQHGTQLQSQVWMALHCFIWSVFTQWKVLECCSTFYTFIHQQHHARFSL